MAPHHARKSESAFTPLRIPSEFEAKAGILKALAHPTRLFLVDVLYREEKNVRDLTNLVGVDISTVSKHLGVLKRAGIVKDERRGLQVFYSLRIPCVIDFFQCLDSVERHENEIAED